MSPVSPLASSAYIAFFFPFSSALTAGASSDHLPPPSSTITRGRLLELKPSGLGVAGRDLRLPKAANPFLHGVLPASAVGNL
jgi:hypothetical protein